MFAMLTKPNHAKTILPGNCSRTATNLYKQEYDYPIKIFRSNTTQIQDTMLRLTISS